MTPNPNATSPYWVHQDGYDETFILVEPDTEKFLGRVIGSRFQPMNGWAAFVYVSIDETEIGTYLTSLSAKTAVIKYLNQMKKDKELENKSL